MCCIYLNYEICLVEVIFKETLQVSCRMWPSQWEVPLSTFKEIRNTVVHQC